MQNCLVIDPKHTVDFINLFCIEARVMLQVIYAKFYAKNHVSVNTHLEKTCGADFDKWNQGAALYAQGFVDKNVLVLKQIYVVVFNRFWKRHQDVMDALFRMLQKGQVEEGRLGLEILCQYDRQFLREVADTLSKFQAHPAE